SALSCCFIEKPLVSGFFFCFNLLESAHSTVVGLNHRYPYFSLNITDQTHENYQQFRQWQY
ncbi:MAG: hypothetical protein KKE94_07160, partial [Gammaproteobacteria bacterium]|nr:hypothetical protein [Gammaproteobacteria bacterium]